MKLRTIANTWYEAVMVGGYGCKLSGSCAYDNGSYNNLREVRKAIKEAKRKAVEGGYKPDEYIILLCYCVRMIDDNGDVVSETITKVRV